MPFPMTLGLAVKKIEIFERVLNRLGCSVKITETASMNVVHNNLILNNKYNRKKKKN